MGMPDGVTRSPDELAADAVGRDVAVRALLRMRSRLMIRQEALIPSERSRPSFRARDCVKTLRAARMFKRDASC